MPTLQQVAKARRRASSENLTRVEQVRLVRHPDTTVRMTLASNPHATDETLTLLAVDSNVDVRAHVFGREDIPAGAMKAFISEGSSSTSQSIARRKNLTPEVQAILAQDASAFVRRNLAAQETLCRDTEVTLSQDAEALVLQQLAWERPDDWWGVDLGAHFVLTYAPAGALGDLVGDHPLDDVHAVGGSWPGSLGTLLEALDLTLR